MITPPHTDRPEPDNAAQHACAQCARLDRRGFLGTASMVSIGALLAACGDGVFDGPESRLELVRDPIRIDPRLYPDLQTVGGRAVITAPGRAPMVVETTAVRQYRAFSLVCPHNGTVVGVVEDGYTCPNHGARFSRNGVWTGGQSTVDLTPIVVTVDSDGSLNVGGVVAPPGPPVLAVSQSTIAFASTVGGAVPAAQTVTISNAGGGALTGVTLALNYGSNQSSGWLAASLSTLATPSVLTLTVARGTLGAGTYTATIRVSAPGASNDAQTIAVTLVVIDTSTPPAVQLSASALSFSSDIGLSPAAKAVQVINSGSGTVGGLSIGITYGAGASGWLSTSSLSGTSTPSTLTVRPLTAALAVGTYSASITVSGAGVASRTLTVTLTVAVSGLAVTIAAWPALANVGGVAGSVGTLNFTAVAVVRSGANSFAAFSLTCPHAGTTVQVQNGQSFRCPNHGALWNANGVLLPNSPQRTSGLNPLHVTYTPGDPVLYVS
ncbi:MAG: Rieske 2Fe-2S domain-containing protein [Gemmatimonadaceae bacterium]|nr:Rieske 2Fe-2S domain-containing protein [Gemmatimonadaceae bacterium]